MKTHNKMSKLVNTLNNPQLTVDDRSAIRWAIVTIQTMRQECQCPGPIYTDTELTSEVRA